MAFVALTRRALRDVRSIERYSEERWGKAVAAEYLESIEEALNRLRVRPTLLRFDEGISPHFTFYRVREHFLICTVVGARLYVLTIKHGAMDLPSRLRELEPQLRHEANLMYQASQKIERREHKSHRTKN